MTPQRLEYNTGARKTATHISNEKVAKDTPWDFARQFRHSANSHKGSRFILTVFSWSESDFCGKSNLCLLTNKRGGNSGTVEKESQTDHSMHRQHTQLPLLFVFRNPAPSSFLHAIVSSSCGDRLSRILRVHCPCHYCDRGFR
jgi:hypothetical protein